MHIFLILGQFIYLICHSSEKTEGKWRVLLVEFYCLFLQDHLVLGEEGHRGPEGCELLTAEKGSFAVKKEGEDLTGWFLPLLKTDLLQTFF